MEDDSLMAVILERPLLATAGALINVKNGKLKIKVRDEEIEFDLNYMMKYLSSTFDVYLIDNSFP